MVVASPEPDAEPTAAQETARRPASPEDIVRVESPNRIRDHFGRKARYNPTKSLTAITGQLTQEYEDRFLVELVQNAYDAHPHGSRGGRVHVRLDERPGAPAVLYVANTGRPFDENNFDGLTNVAQSSKPPGEGIGNKGVGFRSVLQVCDAPEIYSVDSKGPGHGFDGFCFGFATDDEMRLMAGDDARYAIVKKDFSRYLLPMMATPDDPYLQELRHAGMVTVIRLPLANADDVALARAQVLRLLEADPPIALFLDRLDSIAVEHLGPDAAVAAVVERLVEEVPTPPGSPELRWITTVGRRYLTATRSLLAADVREIVHRAIAASGQLDPSWAGWDSDVEVSIAVEPGSDGADAGPVMYTYLPMRVRSPLHAHLHAPFHTKMARLDLKESSLFNSYLLDVAAGLAADTLALLTAGGAPRLDAASRRAAAADLLCWQGDHFPRLSAALADVGTPAADAPLVPCRGPDGSGWARVRDVRAWSGDGLHVLSDDAVRQHALLLDPDLGARRTARLKDVCRRSLGRELDASDADVAEWVELVAGRMESAPATKWNRFLADVARAFEHRDPKALQGRRILLDDKRRLRRAGPWETSDPDQPDPPVFIPPGRTGQQAKGPAAADDDELTRVPKSFKGALAFLHEDIKVRTRTGSGAPARTAVGDLFKNGDLVEPFELSAVLGHLGRLLAATTSTRTYSQALSWVYAQEAASRSKIADLSRLGLRVPTAAGGWLPAGNAVFSPGWKTPRAKSLAALIQHAGGISPAIAAIGEAALCAPAGWPFKIRDTDAFRDFLLRSGVKDGLFPAGLRPRTAVRMDGERFEPAVVAARYGLEAAGPWTAHAQESRARVWLAGPRTPYTGDQHLWTVPGQDAYDRLGDTAKDALAAAVLEALGDWPAESYAYTFRRRSSHHANKQDPQTWPSPVRTFLERESWLPMSDPRSRDRRYFVAPADAWTFEEAANETAPRFARLVPIEHRRRITASPGAASRLALSGLRTWNAPESAPYRLAELGRLTADGTAPEAEAQSVRRAATRAWADLVRIPAPPAPPALPAGMSLVVARGATVGTVEPQRTDPPPVFVLDGAPGLAAQVLETSGLPVLAADPADGSLVAARLAALPGLRVRRASAVNAEVRLDGAALVPSSSAGAPLLDVFGPWLVAMVLAVVDVRSSRFQRITDKVLHETEARLRRTRLTTGARIELSVDGRELAASGRLAECVHLDDPSDPLLVLRDRDLDVPSWRALEVMAEDLADLIGQGLAASELRAAALALQRTAQDWREPSDDELAGALRCAPETVADIRRNLRTTTDHLRWLLAPFVAAAAGADAARLLDAEPLGDLEGVRGLLASLVGVDLAGELLAAAERAETPDDIRRATGTPLGELNAALAELGRPPLHFAEQHATALRSHLNEHRQVVLGALRLRFVAAWLARSPLGEYAAARDFRDLHPDPAWLHDRERPDDAMLRELVGEWTAGKGSAPSAGAAALPPVDAVRDDNRAVVDTAVPELARLVAAWSLKADKAVPEAWADEQKIRDSLGVSGCLDFLPLDRAGLIEWLVALGLWPDGMRQSADARALGLTERDLEKGSAARAGRDDGRRRRRTELPFGGRTFDTATDELRALVEAVAASAGEAFLSSRAAPIRLTDLLPRDGKARGGGGGSGGPPRQYRGTEPSQEQRAAIGLAGEALAYRWLQRHYPETTPDSWVSANRTFLLGGHPGDDARGFDFEIARRNETLFFEVKATTTDEHAFDIGTSELRAARAAPKGRYRILFIEAALQPAHRRLLVLPNPLEASSADAYAQVNQGMRLRFEPP